MLKLGERERRVRGGSVGAAPFYRGRRVVQGDCGRQVKEGELSPLNENQYRARRRRGGRINRGNEGGVDRCGFPPWHCGAWGGGDSRGGPRWKKGGVSPGWVGWPHGSRKPVGRWAESKDKNSFGTLIEF
jgi:hypothetical protein